MADAQTEPKLLLPILRPFYDAVIPLSWLIVRVAVGWNLLVHGYGKVMAGPAPYLKGFVEMGFTPPEPWFWGGLVIEAVGGLAIILGLFTRFFAAAAAIEMLLITLVYWKTGFAWTKRGYEYTLMWGLISLRHRATRRRAHIRSTASSGGSFEGVRRSRALVSRHRRR